MKNFTFTVTLTVETDPASWSAEHRQLYDRFERAIDAANLTGTAGFDLCHMTDLVESCEQIVLLQRRAMAIDLCDSRRRGNEEERPE